MLVFTSQWWCSSKSTSSNSISNNRWVSFSSSSISFTKQGWLSSNSRTSPSISHSLSMATMPQWELFQMLISLPAKFPSRTPIAGSKSDCLLLAGSLRTLVGLIVLQSGLLIDIIWINRWKDWGYLKTQLSSHLRRLKSIMTWGFHWTNTSPIFNKFWSIKIKRTNKILRNTNLIIWN